MQSNQLFDFGTILAHPHSATITTRGNLPPFVLLFVDIVPTSEMIKLYGLHFNQTNRLSPLQVPVREFNHTFTAI